MQTLSTPVVLVHLIAAIVALGVGAVVFLRRKGTATHVWFGRSWAVLMMVVALSSFAITGPDGKYSWIHGLSVFVTAMVPLAVYFAIRGRINTHRQIMAGLYIGGLVIAGLFALHPARLLGHAVWSALGVV